MFKIAVIGAGSVGFSLNFFKDFLLDGDLRERGEIALMDISAERLSHAVALVKILMDKLHAQAKITATLNLEEALSGAKYIITVIRAGKPSIEKLEYEIPRQRVPDILHADPVDPAVGYHRLYLAVDAG